METRQQSRFHVSEVGGDDTEYLYKKHPKAKIRHYKKYQKSSKPKSSEIQQNEQKKKEKT